MRKYKMLFFILVIALLAACGAKDGNKDASSEELIPLDVEFSVPETAEVDEDVELLATVAYGDEAVSDADDVTFEIWEKGLEDESTKFEPTNNGDGTYSMETAFDHDGIYEMYAHVTAKAMHTMPKKSITVGSGASSNHDADHEHGVNKEDFAMHFMEPELIKTAETTSLNVHIQQAGQPLKAANTRFEIWNEETPDQHEWVEAEEMTVGEYSGEFIFPEAGNYQMIIHVENEDGLHEHQKFELNVTA